MNNQPTPQPAGQDRPTWAANFHTRVARYQNLLKRWFWLPLVCAALGITVAVVLIRSAPPRYTSSSRMKLGFRLRTEQTEMLSEEFSMFLWTEQAMIQSDEVRKLAFARIAAQKPNLAPVPVQFQVGVLPKTTVFQLTATAGDPDYAQAFLQACMDEYMEWKRRLRGTAPKGALAALLTEANDLEQKIHVCDKEMGAFASTNILTIIEDKGDATGIYLAELNRQFLKLQYEYDVLTNAIQEAKADPQRDKWDLFQSLEAAAGVGFKFAFDSEVLRLKLTNTILQAGIKELSLTHTPLHPKMVLLQEDLARTQHQLEAFGQQAQRELESRKAAMENQLTQLKKQVVLQNASVLNVSGSTVEYRRLKDNKSRLSLMYERLTVLISNLKMASEVDPEAVTIIQSATPAARQLPDYGRRLPIAALAGLLLSLAILMLIDRLDDRMNSITELNQFFDETVLAQVPREKHPRHGEMQLLQPDDQRHGFLEAFRSIRSSLLYMSESGKAPRCLIVTSSEPNEGKSVTAANLAVTLASSGARVLLVDADLRKGVLHNRLGATVQPGLSDVLANGNNWAAAVQKTPFPTLFFLPRGNPTHKSGELFLSTNAQKFLKEIGAGYDYVVLDTVPVMAADDVVTLAPHADGVVFVIRAQQTSARVARASLEALARRRARILGVVFNAVRQGSGDYYHYYKYKDYYRPQPTA